MTFQHTWATADWSHFDKIPTGARPFGSFTGTQLLAADYPPLRFVVPGLIPAGLTILAGKPKFGKSYAVLDIAVAVATGSRALGAIECEPGDVLYAALEDGERRLQGRLHQLLPLAAELGVNLDRICFETTAQRLDDGLIDKLNDWVALRPDARLIVLDTWVHVKPTAAGRGSAYDEDANGLRPLHQFAKRNPGLGVVLIHHTRKMEAEDVFDTISGTHGLTGIADTLMVLARDGEVVKLSGQGRDIEGFEKALQRDELTGGWRIIGDASERAKTGERQAILDELREAEGKALSPAQLAAATGKERTNIQHLLKRLVSEGLVQKSGYGKWTISDTHSHRSHCSLSEVETKSDVDDGHSQCGAESERGTPKSEHCEQSERGTDTKLFERLWFYMGAPIDGDMPTLPEQQDGFRANIGQSPNYVKAALARLVKQEILITTSDGWRVINADLAADLLSRRDGENAS